jgi:hypothetical protein
MICPGKEITCLTELLGPAGIARFLAKIEVNPINGCWLWQAHLNRKGYPQMKIRGRAWWANRVSYALFRGDIPDGFQVHHERCKDT